MEAGGDGVDSEPAEKTPLVEWGEQLGGDVLVLLPWAANKASLEGWGDVLKVELSQLSLSTQSMGPQMLSRGPVQGESSHLSHDPHTSLTQPFNQHPTRTTRSRIDGME